MEKEIEFANGYWRYVKRSVNLKNFTISYTQEGGFTSWKDAAKAKEIDDARYNMDLARMKKIGNIQYTFKEYIEYWLTDIFIKTTETSTKTIGAWAIRNIILPNTEQDMLLNYITPDFINDILKRCIPVCDSAGEVALKFMRKLLKDAFAYGLLRKDIRDELISVPRKIPKLNLLNKEELKKLLAEASKHTGYYFEILLGLFCGFRSGEIRGLRYSDFDVEKRTIRIARQYTSNYQLADNNGHFVYVNYMEEKKPKADSFRLLHVPDFIFDELEKKRAFNEIIIKNRISLGQQEIDFEYVALSPFGQRKRKGTLLTSLKRTCHKAGVREISFHTLRHQFATMLLEKGVEISKISELLGHSSALVTFNTYCGVICADEDAREAVDTLLPCVGGNDYENNRA